MTKLPLLNVALLGMNDKNISTFTYFIRKHASQYLQIAIADKADVFLVDFDTEAGIRQWHEYCGRSGKAAIVMSALNPEKKRSVWVKKPVTSTQLESAIARLVKLANTVDIDEKPALHLVSEPHSVPVHPATNAEQPKPALDAVQPVETLKQPQKNNQLHVVENNPSAPVSPKKAGYQRSFSDENSPNLTLSKEEIAECCGTQMDGDETEKNFRARVSYDDSKTLLHPLKKAIAMAREKNCAVEIPNLHAQLVILPGGERAVVDFSNHRIRHICAMPMQAMPEIRPLLMSATQCERLFPSHHKNMYSTEAVLWQIALWTSRGRLPKNTDPGQKLCMEYWPNFTRLQITPHAIQIAALWVNHAMSPVEVANTLHIPQRYVFAVAASAQAIEAFTMSETLGHKTVESGWKKPQEFFNTILRSLKIA